MTFQEFCKDHGINPALIAGHSKVDYNVVKQIIEGTYPHNPKPRTIRDMADAIEKLTGKRVDVAALIKESKAAVITKKIDESKNRA